MLAPEIPVRQFHLSRPCPTGQWFQGRGQARIDGVKGSRLGGQGHDQLPVISQHELRPGNEPHDTRQSATPHPPSLIGRVVCTQAASDVGVPTTASHVARWVAVTSAAKTAMWRRSKVRRAYCTLAGPKHYRMSACAHCVSARAANAAHVRANFPFSVPRWTPTGEW